VGSTQGSGTGHVGARWFSAAAVGAVLLVAALGCGGTANAGSRPARPEACTALVPGTVHALHVEQRGNQIQHVDLHVGEVATLTVDLRSNTHLYFRDWSPDPPTPPPDYKVIRTRAAAKCFVVRAVRSGRSRTWVKGPKPAGNANDTLIVFEVRVA